MARWLLRVALAAGPVAAQNLAGLSSGKPNTEGWPTVSYTSQSFESIVLSNNKTGDTAPGFLFVSPRQTGESQSMAPSIFTEDGQLIWRLPTNVYGPNFGPQNLNGTTYLTYWGGDYNADFGFGYGGVVFLDQTYTQKYNICLPDLNIVRVPGTPMTQPCTLDSHESRITSYGTLLVTVRNLTQADLTSVGGPSDGWILDSVWLEVDIPTSNVLLTWSAYQHLNQLDFFSISQVPPAPGKSGKNKTTAWDFFHMNSVFDVPEPAGGFLISSRFCDSAIKTDGSGNIEWYLSGHDGGNFTLPSNGSFQFQHDVQALNVTSDSLTMTLFDNNNRNSSDPMISSGLQLLINYQDFTIDVQRRLYPQNMTASPHTGSFQALPNGHVLIDYGHPPMLNEFDGDGNIVYTAMVGSLANGETYRAYRYEWTATPASGPSVVSQYNNITGQTTAYVSWNGATDLQSWAFASGTSATGNLQVLAQTYPVNGFESMIVINGSHSYLQAIAVGSRNFTSPLVKVLGAVSRGTVLQGPGIGISLVLLLVQVVFWFR